MRLKIPLFNLLLVLLACVTSSVSVSSEYDVDGNGKDDPLTDGLLVLRHQFGLSGTSLTAGVVAEDALVTSSGGYWDYISIKESGNI